MFRNTDPPPFSGIIPKKTVFYCSPLGKVAEKMSLLMYWGPVLKSPGPLLKSPKLMSPTARTKKVGF